MPDDSDPSGPEPDPAPAYAGRTIALVGLMGAGKSTVGRRLAEKLGRAFYDSDTEIEKAAGLSVSDIFALHGEADFRRGEKQVLKRLLELPPHVLATGGGAFIDAETRARTVYLTQIGYISMRVQEPLAVRMSRIPSYVQIFTGIAPAAREMARFHAQHDFVPEASEPR